MALVIAGAVAGAAIGTTRMLRRRRNRDEGGEDEQGYDDEEEGEADDEEPSGRSRSDKKGEESGSGEQSGLRGLAVTFLTEALDALEKDKDDSEPRAEGEDAEPEGSDEDLDDDETEMDEDEDDEEEDKPQRGARAGRRTLRSDQSDSGPVASTDGGGDGTETVEVVARARSQLAELVGREPEAATRVERVDGGWQLSLEVVELDRIPPSTDVLASYDVTLDGEGRLLDYARTRRYCRSRPDEVV